MSFKNYKARKQSGLCSIAKDKDEEGNENSLVKHTSKRFDESTGEELASVDVVFNAARIDEQIAILEEKLENFKEIKKDIAALTKSKSR